MEISMEYLNLQLNLPIRTQNAGYFISRGIGIHSERIIDSYELIFVQRGMLSMHEEGNIFQINAGETLLLRPGRKHGGIENFPHDLRFFWIHFDLKDDPNDPDSNTIDIPQHTALGNPDRLTELFRRFLDDQESERLSQASSDLLMLLMLNEVAQANIMKTDETGTAALLAQRAQSYIKSHLDQLASTSTIAVELDCNPDYLGRVFKNVYGMTIIEAIHHARLRKARNLLIDSEMTIDQISHSCGFEDPGYFRRLFRRQEGMSPSSYRRLYALMHINSE